MKNTISKASVFTVTWLVLILLVSAGIAAGSGSTNYNLQQDEFSSASGEMTSSSYSLAFVAGLAAPTGRTASDTYILNAGMLLSDASQGGEEPIDDPPSESSGGGGCFINTAIER